MPDPSPEQETVARERWNFCEQCGGVTTAHGDEYEGWCGDVEAHGRKWVRCLVVVPLADLRAAEARARTAEEALEYIASTLPDFHDKGTTADDCWLCKIKDRIASALATIREEHG